MMADIYVAERVGFPDGVSDDVKSTWELAFSSPSYLYTASTATDIEVVEPVRLWATIPVSKTGFFQLFFGRGC